MVRDCVDKPIYINQVIEDSTYRTYYRACKQDLCNGGSGKSSVSNSVNNKGGAMNLLVPGTNAGIETLPKTTLILLMFLFTMLII